MRQQHETNLPMSRLHAQGLLVYVGRAAFFWPGGCLNVSTLSRQPQHHHHQQQDIVAISVSSGGLSIGSS
jgi:hypothetical protein